MFALKKVPYKFIVFCSIFFIVDFVIDSANHHFLMPDFRVYYGAANAITGGKQVYDVLFSLGSGYYKYSPFTAFIFYPFTILPYYVACVVYFLLVSSATVFTSVLLLRIFSMYVFKQPVKLPDFILSLSILCISIHLIREIGLGNVNMLLLLLLSLSLLTIIQNKIILPGIETQNIASLLLALVIITKPFYIFLLIPLVMRRYFKTTFTTIILLLLFILSPALILGIGKDIELHKQWLNTMLHHADTFPSPNTIQALIHHFATGITFQYIVIISPLILYVLFVRVNIMNARKDEKGNSASFIIEWFILIALMPSIFRTDTEHFLMSLPIILFILIYIFSNRNVLLTVLFAALIILYAGNSSDLLGKNLSFKIYNMGMLGISNLLLITLALFVYFTYFRKRKVAKEN